MKEKEIRASNVNAILEPDEGVTMFKGIKLRKLTPASLSLCELIDLKVVTSQEESNHSNFEVICFLWVHSRPAKEARGVIFDYSKGKEEGTGRSMVLIETILDWADEIAFVEYTSAAQSIAKLLEESFSGMVEPIEDGKDTKKKPKAKARGGS